MANAEINALQSSQQEDSSVMGSEWDLRDIGATTVDILGQSGVSNAEISKLKDAVRSTR